MSDRTELLIELLKKNMTCNEIAQTLQISNKELYNYLTTLKNLGFQFKRKYFSNGEIQYSLVDTLKDIQKSYIIRENTIYTDFKEETMKIMVISDLHFGSEFERVEVADEIFEYCKKNNINIIMCCGDLIDGTFSKTKKEQKSIYTQIKHFIKDYPHDKNIITFAVGGDHDLSALLDYGQNIVEILNNYRHDVVIGGYGNSVINIKNSSILLYHEILGKTQFEGSYPIKLIGHKHGYYSKINKDLSLEIIVPSLSSIGYKYPSAVEINLSFYKGYIDNVCLKQIGFKSRLEVCNEKEYQLLPNKKIYKNKI